jgi:hypothetical protein
LPANPPISGPESGWPLSPWTQWMQNYEEKSKTYLIWQFILKFEILDRNTKMTF